MPNWVKNQQHKQVYNLPVGVTYLSNCFKLNALNWIKIIQQPRYSARCDWPMSVIYDVTAWHDSRAWSKFSQSCRQRFSKLGPKQNKTEHFNADDHLPIDIGLIPLELVHSSRDAIRKCKAREAYLIKRGQTREPRGTKQTRRSVI